MTDQDLTQNLDNKITKELSKTEELYNGIEDDIAEFAQGMTDFQIEVFIANGEGPIDKFPAHAYRHILAQVRPLLSELRRVLIDKERTLRKITRLELAKPQDWDLDILELEYKLKDLEIDIKGKWKTYETYERLLSHLRSKYGPFTNEDLHRDEAAYWKYRLSKQMMDSKQGAMTGYGAGNINSLRMAIQGSMLPDSPHRIDNFSPTDEELVKNIQGASNGKRMLESK